MYRLLTILLSILTAVSLCAQTTKVKGRVTDRQTGEGIPFVAIYFEGTSVGVTTDLKGYYNIETRDTTVSIISAHIIGYDKASYHLVSGSFYNFDFRLKESENHIIASVVKPDDSRMRRILRRISERRDANDPSRIPELESRYYSKIELDIANPKEGLVSGFLMDKIGFVHDYLDTSVVSGKPYLPVILSESISRRVRSRRYDFDREIIEATRVSGVNPDNAIQQFTGNLLVDINFYRSDIEVMKMLIPSPLSSSGGMFYNYYLIDSLEIDGRKTYDIRFHPKKLVSSPVFDGEMHIDAEDFALRSINARLDKKSNVNFISDVVISQTSTRLPEGTWFPVEDRIYLDFAINNRDRSKLVSFLGTRTIHYDPPSFEVAPMREKTYGLPTIVRPDAGHKDDAFWAQMRPYPLSVKEQGIFNMVDNIQALPIYNTTYGIINTLATNYWEHGKLSYGPFSSLVSGNGHEGLRIRAGVRTTKKFSKKNRYSVSAAYGFKDHKFKGRGSWEHMFSTLPWRKLTVNATHDVVQFSRGHTIIPHETNIFTALGDAKGKSLTPFSLFAVTYDHEWRDGISGTYIAEHRRIHNTPEISFTDRYGNWHAYITATQIHTSHRFSWEEKYTRGVFEKKSVYTKYPIVTVSIDGGLSTTGKIKYQYIQTGLQVLYRLNTGPLGFSKFDFNTGHIFGSVPYPVLKLFEGNNSVFWSSHSFNCMRYYEFAADTWASLRYEHNFGGFFLGKIPLVKKAKMREIVTFNTAWGTISHHNDGSLSGGAPITFPEGLSDLRYPYMEIGAGINNIFRLFRVEAFWRLTHRGENTTPRTDFAVKAGFEFQF